MGQTARRQGSGGCELTNLCAPGGGGDVTDIFSPWLFGPHIFCHLCFDLYSCILLHVSGSGSWRSSLVLLPRCRWTRPCFDASLWGREPVDDDNGCPIWVVLDNLDGAQLLWFCWWPPWRHVLLPRVSISTLRLLCHSIVCVRYTCSFGWDSRLDLSDYNFICCWTFHSLAHDYLLLYYEWIWIHKRLIRIIVRMLYPNNILYREIYGYRYRVIVHICCPLTSVLTSHTHHALGKMALFTPFWASGVNTLWSYIVWVLQDCIMSCQTVQEWKDIHRI